MHSSAAPLGAWTPRRRGSRLAAWFRADASNILLTSGAVERWYDRSGNGRDMLQSTPGNRLGWSASEAAFGDRAALLGTDGGWLDAIAAWDISQPVTIYVVGQSGSYADWRTFFDCPVSAARVAVRSDPSNVLATYAQGSANLFGGSVSGPSVVAAVFNGASSAHYISSTSAAVMGSATVPGTSGIGTPRIGAGPGGAYALRTASRIAEVIVLTGADSAAELAATMRYLRGWYRLPVTGL